MLVNAEPKADDEGLAMASLLLNMGGIFLYQGQWKEAEMLFVQVMETRKRLLGEKHPSTLDSIGNLASTYQS